MSERIRKLAKELSRISQHPCLDVMEEMSVRQASKDLVALDCFKDHIMKGRDLMKRVAKFEKVSIETFAKSFEGDCNKIYDSIALPKRATKGSAGYDISTPIKFTLMPDEKIVIPTGLKCKIEEGYVMLIDVRSSIGIKRGLMISNIIPVIDSDYYNNVDNEGHIFICLKNTKKEAVTVDEGERIAQAIFIPFGITEDDMAEDERKGGIGSSGRQ